MGEKRKIHDKWKIKKSHRKKNKILTLKANILIKTLNTNHLCIFYFEA